MPCYDTDYSPHQKTQSCKSLPELRCGTSKQNRHWHARKDMTYAFSIEPALVVINNELQNYNNQNNNNQNNNNQNNQVNA